MEISAPAPLLASNIMNQIRLAARAIEAGGVVAYPTEAVYGLGCDPWNPDAVERLLAIKRRPPSKGLIIIACDWLQVYQLAKPLPESIAHEMAPHWPGPVTYTLPARDDTPPWLKGKYNTIAIRLTAHPIAAALCSRANQPIVSTSANRHGQPATRSALETRLRLGLELDAIVAGPTGGRTKPSEIRDPFTQHIFRQG